MICLTSQYPFSIVPPVPAVQAKTAMLPGARGGPWPKPANSSQTAAALGIFLELWGQGARSIMVALLINCWWPSCHHLV